MAAEKEKKTTVWSVLAGIGDVIYKLRGILLSIPVLGAAIMLAIRNASRLPETVGIFLLENGDYKWMVAREMAVNGPVVLTAACLVMVLCSRRVVYPLLISIFSLVIPIVIWITNIFPA